MFARHIHPQENSSAKHAVRDLWSACLFVFYILLVVFLTPTVASAETPLQPRQIEAFITATPQLTALGKKYNLEQPGSDNTETTEEKQDINIETSPFGSALTQIKSHRAYGEFQNIIKRAGFSSDTEWASVGNRIIKAMVATEIENEGPQSKNELTEAISQVKNNPHITDEQKQAIIATLEETLSSMASFKSESKSDVSAIKPYMTELKNIFKDQP